MEGAVDFKKVKILLHHHALAYQDAVGVHIQSFIGEWAKALSMHFEEVGLLLPATQTKHEQQDTLLSVANIHLYPLPTGGKRWDYFQRKQQIARVCRQVSGQYDILLVRGITPRQWTVWRNCQTPHKAFLLVGSLCENRPKFGWRWGEFLTWGLTQLRRWEFGKIANGRRTLLSANSPYLVKEIAATAHTTVHFIPTNTLRKAQISPFEPRPVSLERCKLLFVGRVVQDKGIEDLIAALSLLRQPSALLKIVGKVSPPYLDRLIRLSKSLGVGAQIVWQGFVPFGEDLLMHYKEADLLVLPSWHEGFPHCIWEAAATSTPVLVTAVGGIPGLVDDGLVTFIKKRSPKDIAAKITFLTANQILREEKTARLHALCKEYTVESGAAILKRIVTAHTDSIR